MSLLSSTGDTGAPWPRRSTAGEGFEPSGAFESASRTVLSLLADRVGLRLWLVTRVSRDTQTLWEASGELKRMLPDALKEWGQSFCSAVMADGVSIVAPDVSQVSALEDVVATSDFVMGAFIGVPLWGPDGEMFGSLCGIDPEPSDSGLVEELRLIEVLGSMLSSLLALEMSSDEAELRAIEALERGQTDGLTGVLNRAGWDQAIERAGERCRTLGQGASVLLIDLNDLKAMNDRYGHGHGDEQIRALANCITAAARADDIVARLGGDEFALLAPGSSAGAAEELAQRLRNQFEQNCISAAVGAAECPPGGDVVEAWRRADVKMYAEKRTARTTQQTAAPQPEHAIDLAAVVDAAVTLARCPLRLVERVRRSL